MYVLSCGAPWRLTFLLGGYHDKRLISYVMRWAVIWPMHVSNLLIGSWDTLAVSSVTRRAWNPIL